MEVGGRYAIMAYSYVCMRVRKITWIMPLAVFAVVLIPNVSHNASKATISLSLSRKIFDAMLRVHC